MHKARDVDHRVARVARSTARHRWRLLGLIVAIAVGAAALGWVVGRGIRSPEELATEREPPEPSLIAVPVEKMVLNSTIVVRGDIRFSGSEELTLDTDIAAGVEAVVTGQLPAEGDDVDEGDVLIEVSGRPVIALVGELPMFRSLGPGSVGDDVSQLEEGLARLGYDTGTVDELFDGDTEQAIEGLYVDRGYVPPGPTDDEMAQLQAAEDAVDLARDRLRDAQADLARAGEGLPLSQRLQWDATVEEATRSLAQVRTDTAARVQAATDAANGALTARDGAQVTYDLAAERLARAEAGTHPDTGLPPLGEELDVLREEAADALADLTAAETALTAAENELVRVKSESVDQITIAESNLEIAEAARAEALAAPDTTFERRAVSDARAALDEATAELTALDLRLGTTMPKGELVFLDVLPRRVDQVLVERGDLVSGPVMRISGADIVIDASVAEADRSLVAVGDRVVIDDEALGILLEGEIIELADRPGGQAARETSYYMQVVPEEGDPLELRGLNVRLTIPIESTDGEVLAVPLAALSAGADGSARVQVERAPDVTEMITVSVGLRAGGFVEVDPLEGSLEPGDQVVVGTG